MKHYSNVSNPNGRTREPSYISADRLDQLFGGKRRKKVIIVRPSNQVDEIIIRLDKGEMNNEARY